jgi:hypothetical protein
MTAANYKLNETQSEAKERLGKLARFLVWNGVVYALESIQPFSVAPAHRSTSYVQHSILFDNIIGELAHSPQGAWVYIRERKKWYCLPLSLVERRVIAAFDRSVMEYIPVNTPKEPVFPL